MKKSYILLLFLLFTASYTYAQQDFRQGYIVLQGDTVKGFVDYRGSTRSARSATFKASPTDAARAYAPDEITAYGFKQEQKHYEAREVPAPDSAAAPEILFLNVLLKGKASLYYYRDNAQADHYYLLQEGGLLQELRQQKFYMNDPATGKTYKGINKLFAATLASAFRDCGTITSEQLKHIDLKASALIRITKKYNACVAPASISYQQPIKKTQARLGAVISYFNPVLAFDGDNYLSKASFNNNGKATVGGGLSFNATLPKINEKLSVQADLLYIPAKFTAVYEEDGPYTNKVSYDILFDLTYLKLPVQLRYTYPRGQLQPFVNAGILFGYAVKKNNQTTTTNSFGGKDSAKTTRALLPQTDGYRKLMQGITVGAGVTYPLQKHQLLLEARYEANNGMSAIRSLSSSVNTLYILLSCSF